MASNLLKFRKSGPYKGFISKKKKKFSAALLLHQKDGKWQVSFDFDQDNTPGAVKPKRASTSDEGDKKTSPQSHHPQNQNSPICPLCGGKIIEGKKGYGCGNWHPSKGDCKFVIWKEIMGKTLTGANIKTLVSGKSTRSYVFKTDQGKKFKGTLKMISISDGTNKNYAVEVSPLNEQEQEQGTSNDGKALPKKIIPCFRT
jgi:DNA topoisomerase-3